MDILVDASLSLINRTGAHVIARELLESLPDKTRFVRRWRLLGRRLPEGLYRKVCARLMLKEISWLMDSQFLSWPEPSNTAFRRLFLDPLYVMRSRLTAEDIVLCHDIGPITHPHLFSPTTVTQYRLAYSKILKAGPGMVFVSNSTKEAFTNSFGVAFRYLRVIPLFVRPLVATGATSPPSGVRGDFVLTVGALEKRKNQHLAIQAFAKTGLAMKGIQYILCGPYGDGAAEILDEAARTPGVVVLGYTGEAELRWLYQHATAFLLPSLLEGFGIPALEAANYGTIPVISRESALDEAINSLGIAVDPGSVEDIARGLLLAFAMPANDREQMAARLIEHARSCSRDRFISAWDSLLSEECR